MIALAEDKRKVAFAVFGSLLLHLFGFGGMAVYLALISAVPIPDLRPEPKPIEVTFVPTAPPEEQREVPPMLLAPEHAPDAETPERPDFESDRDTRAAAERLATGQEPLPTQEGAERPFMDFETREFTPGEPAVPAAPPQLAAATQRPTPIPRPTPEATPPPPREALALLPPAPTPTPEPVTAVPPPPRPPAPAGYQPHNERTRIEGSIDNLGRSSVEAAGTPLGKYRKLISEAIGSRWHHYTRARMDLIRIGTARIKFYINEQGEIENLRVLENNSNEVFATCSVQAIMEAEIPPIPDDIAATLENRRLEIEYSFTVY